MSNNRCRLDGDGKVIPKTYCSCGHELDPADKLIGEYTAKPGDISVCLNCGEVVVLGQDMVLRPAQLNDLLNIDKRTMAYLDLLQRKVRAERPLEKNPKNPVDRKSRS